MPRPFAATSPPTPNTNATANAHKAPANPPARRYCAAHRARGNAGTDTEQAWVGADVCGTWSKG